MENYQRYVGAVLDNRYKIEKVIGIGGMAVVFKAEDTLMRRNVAVKILKDEIAKDEQSVKRFINESKAVSMLSHPNIVNIYDVSMKNAEKYIVMEYIEGITLKNYMSRKGVLSLREIIGYTEQILRALEHAHAKGIVHRDIKPQNIMLLKNGIVKVTDFGIAKLPNAETVTMTDKAIGTVYYISPEQASGNSIDARSDLYSLGVLMYEMATGKLPFTADNPVSVALMQINESAPKPRELNERIPKGLEQIITRAIEKSPELRYQDVSMMMKQLQKLKENPNVQFKQPKNNVNKQKKKKVVSRTMFPIILGVVIPFLIIAAICGVVIVTDLLANTGNTTETITVNNFVGQVYSDEMQKLFDDPSSVYKVTVNLVYSNEHEAGKIISQSPGAGETRRIDRGKKQCELTLTVSQGPKNIEMPDITYLNYQEAKLLLNKLGVTNKCIEVMDEENEMYPINSVIRTIPAAGEIFENGSIVTIYRCIDMESEKITVPDFVGMNEGEALKLIVTENLHLNSVIIERSDKPVGTVIDQSVDAGEEVYKFYLVDLTISGGEDYGADETETETEIETETDKKTETVTETETETETSTETETVTETESSTEDVSETETEPVVPDTSESISDTDPEEPVDGTEDTDNTDETEPTPETAGLAEEPEPDPVDDI